MLDDGWTVVTGDGSWAAHFEHTFAVTERPVGPHSAGRRRGTRFPGPRREDPRMALNPEMRASQRRPRQGRGGADRALRSRGASTSTSSNRPARRRLLRSYARGPAAGHQRPARRRPVRAPRAVVAQLDAGARHGRRGLPVAYVVGLGDVRERQPGVLRDLAARGRADGRLVPLVDLGRRPVGRR